MSPFVSVATRPTLPSELTCAPLSVGFFTAALSVSVTVTLPVAPAAMLAAGGLKVSRSASCVCAASR